MTEQPQLSNFDPPAQQFVKEQSAPKIGELKIFFGMSAGVGKTHAMLEEAQQKVKEGVDVVIGIVKTHGQQEIEQLVTGIPTIPEKILSYRGETFQEMDLEQILQRKPALVIVDELAHSNVPGSKHLNRWQDVIELLDTGINVYTTLNVQHIESYKDLVEDIVSVHIQESVPDVILERAATIELIDIDPSGLLKRMKEGKVFLGDQTEEGKRGFFKEDILTALRKISLKFTANRVVHDLHTIFPQGKEWRTNEKLMVVISPSSLSQELIRETRRKAFDLDITWVALYVELSTPLTEEERNQLLANLNLARELGGEVVVTQDLTVSSAIQRVAKLKNISQLVLRRPRDQSLFTKIFHIDDFNKIERENKNLDLFIIRQEEEPEHRAGFSLKRAFQTPLKEYLFVAGVIAVVTLLCLLLQQLTGYRDIDFIFIATIFFLSACVGFGAVILSAVLTTVCWMSLFISPSLSTLTASELVSSAIFFVISLTIGLVTNRLWTQNRLIKYREKKAGSLYEIQKVISNASNFRNLRLNVCSKLQTIFGGHFDLLMKDSSNNLIFDSPLTQINEKEKNGIQWVFENGKSAGWSTPTYSSSAGLFLPLQFSQSPLGALVYYPKPNSALLSIEELNLLQTVAGEISFFLTHH